MKLIRFIFFPFSILYGIAILIRNYLFSKGIRKGVEFDLPIICVGNLSTGGTGKTPHSEYLIEQFSEKYQTAILSRGYKRLTKGFVRADENTTWQDVGDEPLQYYFKYADKVSVQVDEERIRGVIRIAGDQPNTDLVILDDAYQHRSLKPGFTILLTDFQNPFYADYLLPMGDLREFRSGKNRADYIVVTKCPEHLSKEEKSRMMQRIDPNSNQKVFFSRIHYKGIFNLKNQKIEEVPENILLITGIAKSGPIVEILKDRNVKHLKYPDHYRFKQRDIEKITDIFGNFAAGNKIILTTVKDLMRLRFFKSFMDELGENIHYLDISIKIDEEKEFLNGIENYIESNKRDDSVHSE